LHECGPFSQNCASDKLCKECEQCGILGPRVWRRSSDPPTMLESEGHPAHPLHPPQRSFSGVDGGPLLLIFHTHTHTRIPSEPRFLGRSFVNRSGASDREGERAGRNALSMQLAARCGTSQSRTGHLRVLFHTYVAHRAAGEHELG